MAGRSWSQWKAFIIRPLVYELLAVWLIALPFLLLWLVLYRRPLRSPRWRLGHWALVALMAANLLITAFDHELYRFLGLRLGPNFLDVYADPTTLADSLFLNVLRGDRGGPFLSPILCVGAPALYLWWAIRMVRRRTRARPPPRFGFRPALAILVLPLATGLIGYSLAHAKFRLSRLEPASVRGRPRFRLELRGRNAARRSGRAGPRLAGRMAGGQRRPRLALSRTATCPSSGSRPIRPRRRRQDRWNVIIIQLESVRGVDTGHLRPDRRPSPTPYLDSLAARPDAAVWTRALSFGPPSINGRFAPAMLDHAVVAPVHHRPDPRHLLLPVRRAAPAGLSRRDVRGRRHRHG